MKPPEFGQPGLSNNESEAIHILNTSRKHVNYEKDKNKVPMNKPYNIQNTNTVLPRSIAPRFIAKILIFPDFPH